MDDVSWNILDNPVTGNTCYSSQKQNKKKDKTKYISHHKSVLSWRSLNWAKYIKLIPILWSLTKYSELKCQN
jgi:hypothetical protein